VLSFPGRAPLRYRAFAAETLRSRLPIPLSLYQPGALAWEASGPPSSSGLHCIILSVQALSFSSSDSVFSLILRIGYSSPSNPFCFATSGEATIWPASCALSGFFSGIFSFSRKPVPPSRSAFSPPPSAGGADEFPEQESALSFPPRLGRPVSSPAAVAPPSVIDMVSRTFCEWLREICFFFIFFLL